jgi:hypothetical protein
MVLLSEKIGGLPKIGEIAIGQEIKQKNKWIYHTQKTSF